MPKVPRQEAISGRVRVNAKTPASRFYSSRETGGTKASEESTDAINRNCVAFPGIAVP